VACVTTRSNSPRARSIASSSLQTNSSWQLLVRLPSSFISFLSHFQISGNPHIRLYDITSNATTPSMSFDSAHSGFCLTSSEVLWFFEVFYVASITALGFQKDGRWMWTASEDNSIKIWDMRASGCCQRLAIEGFGFLEEFTDCGISRELKSSHPINACALHPNQAELIAGDQNGNLFVWDLTTNTRTRSLQPDGEVAIRSISVAPNGSLCVAANNTGYTHVFLFVLFFRSSLIFM
jgi:target of rapamycin complex subunit LST8